MLIHSLQLTQKINSGYKCHSVFLHLMLCLGPITDTGVHYKTGDGQVIKATNGGKSVSYPLPEYPTGRYIRYQRDQRETANNFITLS